MTSPRLLLTALLAVAAAAAPASAQVIAGVVVDSAAEARVAEAQVVLIQNGFTRYALTDSTGAFRFEASPGAFVLRISALGYGDLLSPPHTVSAGERLDIRVLVVASPVAMDPLIVQAQRRRAPDRLAGFRERMASRARQWAGYFMDADAIEKFPAYTVSDIMRRIPGADANDRTVSLRPHCRDAIYVLDGLHLGPIGDMTATEMINSMVSAQDIAGIEVYKGEAAIPMELQVGLAAGAAESASCGVIAIWTKRGR